ncbi:MAG TPA: hypothetical protein VFF79_18345 [Conexibacter sp.]|jgi:hypothetical protein|nr:hypothetical protein [Conexibacter sp.]
MDAEELIASLDAPLLSGASRPKLLARILLGLLDADGRRIYAPVAERADTYVPALGRAELQVELLLTLWALAPADKNNGYAREVAVLGSGTPNAEIEACLSRRATAVVVRLIRRFGQGAGGDDDNEMAHAFETLQPFLLRRSVAETEQIVSAAREALASEWTSDMEQQAARVRLHRALATLAETADLDRELRALRGEDLLRARPDDPERLDVWLLGVAEMAEALDEATIRELLTALPDGVIDGEASDAALLAHVALSQRLSRQGVLTEVPQYRVALLAALRGGRPSAAATAAFAEWLEFDPPARAVAESVIAYGSSPSDGAAAALREWAGRVRSGHSRKRRNTSLLRQLVSISFNAERWAGALAGSEVEERPIVERVRSELFLRRAYNDRLNDYRRLRLVSVLVGRGLRTRNARSDVASICAGLLASGQPSSNLAVVVRLCPLLRSDYDRKQALARAVERHRAKHDYKLNEEQTKALLSAGVPLKEEWLRSKARGRIEGLKAEATQLIVKVRGARRR